MSRFGVTEEPQRFFSVQNGSDSIGVQKTFESGLFSYAFARSIYLAVRSIGIIAGELPACISPTTVNPDLSYKGMFNGLVASR